MSYPLNSKLVTIAIPAYKSTYLFDAIGSALNQSYSNIELVIVNDHSPFDIKSIINKFDDSRIRYYENNTNLGKKSIVHNWNRCLEYANGDYFVLLCDDDVLMTNFVSSLLSLAEKYPNCNVFHGRRKLIDERTGEEYDEAPWPEYEQSEDFIRNCFNGLRKHTISEFLYRTSYIKQIKYLVFPIGYYSDDASLISFSKDGGIVSSQQCLATFRFSSEHISSNPLYNVGKAKAAKLFIRWAKKDNDCRKYVYKFIEIYNRDSIYLFYGAQSWDKFRILQYINISGNIMNIIKHFWDTLKKKVFHSF